MTQEIKINKKFKDYLFQLTNSEFEMLERNILLEGIKDPITLWKGEIVDGHNRYEIAQKHNLQFKTTELNVETEEEVLAWMDNNQLGRRNLTDLQRDIIIGRLYNSIKNPQGAGKNMARTDERLSKTTGLSTGTINRASKTFNDLNKVKEQSVDLWDSLVNEEVKINKRDLELISSNVEFVNKCIVDGENLKNIRNLIKRENSSKISLEGIDISLESKVENTDAISFLRSLKTDSVNLVVTDPPYGIEFKASRNVGNEEFNDSETDTLLLLENCCNELKRVVKDGSHLYFFSGYTHLESFKEIISRYFTVQDNPLIWVKNNHTMCNFQMKYANKYEFIIFAQKGTRSLNNKISTDVLEHDKPTNKIHDCEKPIDLLQYLIQNSSEKGEVVCDPFGGSLSTYKSAIGIDRKCYTCELDETIYKIAVNSLKK